MWRSLKTFAGSGVYVAGGILAATLLVAATRLVIEKVKS